MMDLSQETWSLTGQPGSPEMIGGQYEVVRKRVEEGSYGVRTVYQRVALVDMNQEDGALGAARRARLIAVSPTLLSAAKRMIRACALFELKEGEEGDENFEEITVALRELGLVVMTAEGVSLQTSMEKLLRK